MNEAPAKIANELATTVAVMLEKYEIHNEVLAIELAMYVLEREKKALRQAHSQFEQILQGAA